MIFMSKSKKAKFIHLHRLKDNPNRIYLNARVTYWDGQKQIHKYKSIGAYSRDDFLNNVALDIIIKKYNKYFNSVDDIIKYYNNAKARYINQFEVRGWQFILINSNG